MALALCTVLGVSACDGLVETDAEVLWSLALPWSEAVARYGESGEEWAAARAEVVLPDALVGELESLPGRWRMLVVSEAWCADSREALPWLDGLASALPNLELRMVDSRVGRHLKERYRTPDDRGATPTLVVLAEDGSEVGCWVERPAGVQAWWLGGGRELDRSERLAAKAEWWKRDRGYHLLDEIAGILQAAAAGTPICARPYEAREALPEPGWPLPSSDSGDAP
ncbi:MAG: hypothetical protein HKN71_00785 [Gemmatimonadetes bacterium]|nr:hypothetical protein [Gemmatimonadota bacterium]